MRENIWNGSERAQVDLPSESFCLALYFSSCKPRIGGRQCDRCAPGYYRFPECIPCNCNRDGVTPDVCHPDSGRCLCKVTLSCLCGSKTSSSIFVHAVSCCSELHRCHIFRKMLQTSSVTPARTAPSTLTTPTLTAAPAASVLGQLTGVGAPVNAEGRCALLLPLHVNEYL